MIGNVTSIHAYLVHAYLVHFYWGIKYPGILVKIPPISTLKVCVYLNILRISLQVFVEFSFKSPYSRGIYYFGGEIVPGVNNPYREPSSPF